MEDISDKVKELRRVKGWSQEELARQVPVSSSTVQRWERGRPVRGVAARQSLARLFVEAGIELPEALAKGGKRHE